MQTKKPVIFIFAGLSLWYLLAAALLPLTQDEAYYLSWASKPAAGYFDHPPAVAWLAHLGQLLNLPQLFSGRLPAIALALLSVLGLAKFYRLCGLRRPEHLATSLLTCAGSGAVLLGGLLTTPDIALFCAWVWAMHTCALALKGQKYYWLAAGICTGLGLLSKFTMLLIGPVFLIVLLLDTKRKGGHYRQKQLFSPWPYLGGLLALGVFLPNLIWNSQNDWITWKFQLRHGLAMERSHLGQGAEHLGQGAKQKRALPKPLPEIEGSPEARLAQIFIPEGEDASSVAARFAAAQAEGQQGGKFFAWLKGFTAGGSVIGRLADYAGGQLALWGALLFSFIFSVAVGRQRRHPGEVLDENLKPLLLAGTFVPLCVFAAFALKGKVEANWGAVYVVSAAPWLMQLCALRVRAALMGTLVNMVLLATVIGYTRLPFGRINPGFDRVLQETHGYDQLAQWMKAKTSAAVYADRYQLVAMLEQKGLQGRVGQWPGITRSSEFVRNPQWQPFAWDELKQHGSFVLITSNLVPPRIPEFTAKKLTQVLDCREGYLKEQESWTQADIRPCSVVHRWRVVEYFKQAQG